jgi:hypothetical protein
MILSEKSQFFGIMRHAGAKAARAVRTLSRHRASCYPRSRIPSSNHRTLNHRMQETARCLPPYKGPPDAGWDYNSPSIAPPAN